MSQVNIDSISITQFGEALRSEIVAQQNDTFRNMVVQCESVGRWVVTHAVNEEGPSFVAACIAAVRAFDAFNEDMDPHGDHSMGSFEVEGKTVWFKIDLYDTAYEGGSPDPLEVTKTRRVLTILFPSDY